LKRHAVVSPASTFCGQICGLDVPAHPVCSDENQGNCRAAALLSGLEPSGCGAGGFLLPVCKFAMYDVMRWVGDFLAHPCGAMSGHM
jgi:hypothetical protein